MSMFWEFPEELQLKLVELHFGKHGSLIGSMSSPHSSIFTFDSGSQSYPRYVVAKGVRVEESMPAKEKRAYFARSLYEVNNAYAVCHHPLVQRFFDLEIVHGVPFLLSCKRDATLRDVIAEAPIPEPEALSIAIQIVHTLAYCAKKGIVCHQDLKPENVFIDFFRDHYSVSVDYLLRCHIYIADFELANAYFVLRHPYGSRPYMAPEQYGKLRDAPTTDFSRTDVFAIGVILFEMLTGGVHPVGEHTSLIWPTPVEGKSRKWLREDPWKQWLKNDAPTPTDGNGIAPQMLLIIQDCLKTEVRERISKDALEARLLERLRYLDENVFDTLSVTLTHFDQLASGGEEGGWPYYEDRIRRLNEAFSDNQLP